MTDRPKAYTWADATKDLALSSPLSIHEAHAVVWPLRETSLAPYVALPHLVRLVAATATSEAIGTALAALVNPPGQAASDD